VNAGARVILYGDRRAKRTLKLTLRPHIAAVTIAKRDPQVDRDGYSAKRPRATWMMLCSVPVTFPTARSRVWAADVAIDAAPTVRVADGMQLYDITVAHAASKEGPRKE
jgi:hypothetical protein